MQARRQDLEGAVDPFLHVLAADEPGEGVADDLALLGDFALLEVDRLAVEVGEWPRSERAVDVSTVDGPCFEEEQETGAHVELVGELLAPEHDGEDDPGDDEKAGEDEDAHVMTPVLG